MPRVAPHPAQGLSQNLLASFAEANGDVAALLLAHVPAAVALFDNEMRYLACSQRWLVDYRITDQQVVGRSHYEVFPEITEAWRTVHRQVLAGEHLTGKIEPFTRADNSIDWVEWEMVPWRKQSGEIGGALLFTHLRNELVDRLQDAHSHEFFNGELFLRDLAARREAEARIHDLQAELIRIARVSAVATLATALTHELNQPLTAVANYVQTSAALIAQGNNEMLDLVKEALEEAGNEVLRAGAIVNRLRQFATGGQLDHAVLSPRELALETCALNAAAAPSSGITCEVIIAPDIGPVLADRVHIQKVLLNLIRNAIDAIGDAGTITIDARIDFDMIRITVEDTGRGLLAGDEERLFETFISGKSRGMGLGLAICRTIIEAHGGRLWCEPAPGGGAAFHFTLPAAKTDEEEPN